MSSEFWEIAVFVGDDFQPHPVHSLRWSKLFLQRYILHIEQNQNFTRYPDWTLQCLCTSVQKLKTNKCKIPKVENGLQLTNATFTAAIRVTPAVRLSVRPSVCPSVRKTTSRMEIIRLRPRIAHWIHRLRWSDVISGRLITDRVLSSIMVCRYVTLHPSCYVVRAQSISSCSQLIAQQRHWTANTATDSL